MPVNENPNSIDYNKNCYKLEELYFEEGFLDASVDVTYIITMYNNFKRHRSIFKQLEKFKPTKRVVIVYNYGYKLCEKYKKQHKIDATYEDLTYTYMYIFNLANQYNNILILEDDFIFSDTILDKYVTRDINSFIITRNPDIYYLGLTVSFFNLFTMFNTHIKCYKGGGTHAVIYSKAARKLLFTKFMEYKIFHIDDMQFKYIDNKYFYYKPLCMQSFPDTENRKTWGINRNMNRLQQSLHTFVTKFGKYYFKILKLDKDDNLEQKYKLHYNIVKTYHIILVILIFYQLFVVYKKPMRFIKFQ